MSSKIINLELLSQYNNGVIQKISTPLFNEIDRAKSVEQQIQSDLDNLKNNPDVVDIVTSYAVLLQKYPEDASTTLNNQDIVRVLTDETHNNQSSYYQWNKPTHTWSYIGSVGNYYTKAETDELLDEKYDKVEGVTFNRRDSGQTSLIQNGRIRSYSAPTSGDSYWAGVEPSGYTIDYTKKSSNMRGHWHLNYPDPSTWNSNTDVEYYPPMKSGTLLVEDDLDDYVKKITTIAGIDLQNNITKDELITALNNDALSVNNTTDNIQAIITSNDSSVEQGNLSAIISSDTCTIGDLSADKNGRQTIISSKNSTTNGNDTVVIAARESEIISDSNSHSTESAIIGGYSNVINKTQRATIAGGSENTIIPVSGSDALYSFIGGGQNNQVRYRNSATIGGQHLTTTNPEQVLVGRYNKTDSLPDSDILFAIGTGTSSTRKNGFWVSPTKTFIEKPVIGSPLKISGGDGDNAAKIILDQTQSGQITNNGTNTLFGFTNSSTDLKVGHSNYTLSLRGSGDLKYNDKIIPNQTYVDTADALKVDKTNSANKIYGTDSNGAQTTYDKDSFGQVDDVRINNISIVSSKIANIVIDSALSASSDNAIKNSVVTEAINTKSNIGIARLI